MSALKQITTFFDSLFRKRQLEADLDEEMRLHVELKTKANIKAGMPPDEARLAAIRAFGWAESIKESCRDQRGTRWVENLLQDSRFGVRILCKSPGFTSIAVVTLALGIGATTAIFSVVKTTLFDPLPVRDASDRYLQLVAINKKQGWYGFGINAPALRDVQQQTNLFSRVAAYEFEWLTLKGEEFLEPVQGQRVTPEFFRLWTLRPQKGRVFSEDEAQPGRDDVMVISYQFWQKRLGGDPNVIGRLIRFQERPMTVIGVMPPFFVFPTAYYEYWRPFRGPQIPDTKGPIPEGAYEWLPNTGVIAEMRTGISQAQVQAFLDVVSRRQAQEAPVPNAEFDIRCREMIELFSKPELRRTLWILLGAVGFVLLIASANIANLQLARTERRQAELAVRTALGAGRSRVFQQLLTENLLLACLGGLASVAVIYLGLELLQKLIPPELPRLKPISINAGVLWIALGATLVTAVLFGLLPAKLGIRSRLSEALKLGSATTSRDCQSGRLSNSLIVCQVAVACVLLAGAGLMVRSVTRLLTVNPGFDPRNVVRVRPGVDTRPFLSDQELAPEKLDAIFQDMQRRVAAIPGVVAAGTGKQGWELAVSTSAGGPTINLEDQFTGIGEANSFRTLRAPLIAGRWPDHGDAAKSAPGVLLNETAARRLWPGENAVGKRLWFKRGDENVACEVVGVVGDMRLNKYDEIPKPVMVRVLAGADVYGTCFLVVRTTKSPLILYQAIGRELKAAGAGGQPYFDNLQETLYAATAGHRTLMGYLLVFASVGVFLATIGLYGILAYSAARRTREIGIRMALGAKRHEVLALIMAQGMRLLVVGLIVGLICALALGRALSAFMFGITNHDPLTLVSVAVLFSIIAGLASYLPARRAAKLDPMKALRYE